MTDGREVMSVPSKETVRLREYLQCAKGINYLWTSSDTCSISVPPNCCYILSDNLSVFAVVGWLSCRTDVKCIPYANETVYLLKSFRSFSWVGAIYNNRCIQHIQLCWENKYSLSENVTRENPGKEKVLCRCNCCSVSADSVWHIWNLRDHITGLSVI